MYHGSYSITWYNLRQIYGGYFCMSQLSPTTMSLGVLWCSDVPWSLLQVKEPVFGGSLLYISVGSGKNTGERRENQPPKFNHKFMGQKSWEKTLSWSLKSSPQFIATSRRSILGVDLWRWGDGISCHNHKIPYIDDPSNIHWYSPYSLVPYDSHHTIHSFQWIGLGENLLRKTPWS